MMQILEKLPGITVERCSLLDRTYTCPEQDPPRDKTPRRRFEPKVPPRPEMARRREAPQHRGKTRATAHSVTMRQEAPFSREIVRPQSRDKSNLGYMVRPPSGRGSKFDMEVSGNSALPRPRITVSDTGGEKSSEEVDVFPLDPPPMPKKSILKRTGSGMSNRSSRSVGGMSLDSGMARLTASLIARSKSNDILPIERIAAKHERGGGERSATNTPSTLPHLGALSSRRGGANEPEQMRPGASHGSQDASRGVAVSPSKSVTFKLDPEVSRSDHANADSRLERQRGGARWSVSFSPHNSNAKELKTVKGAVPEFTVKRSNFGMKEQRPRLSFDQSLNVTYNENTEQMSASEKRKLLQNSYSSSALLRPRPDGGITGVSGIHLMADPYRRYLMARAAEEAKKFASEGRGKQQNNAAPLSRSLNEESMRSALMNFGRTGTTDKAHPHLPASAQHQPAAPLPALKRRDR